MGRVAGLTPILDESTHTMESLSDTILGLSQVVPTGPIELADALYFAGSAGRSAESALEIVELAAKGAAIGMGEASDISKVLIFSLNAFESQGLTAAQAMDALTVAVREGTAEPEELAIALGRLLPVAKQAGITFQEVVGAVASLTNIGFPARVATVALRALFAELLAPTQQATERLNSLGVSADQLRDSMRFGGPIAAFELLNNAVRGDEDALRDILPQIRGFSAFVGITGDRLQETIEIMEKATNATGALGRAFTIIKETPAVKFRLALNKLSVAAIEVGNILIPVLDKVSAVIGEVADRIADLPPGLQKALVMFLGLAAALGPVLKLFGNMGALSGGLISGFTQVSTTIAALGIASFVLYGSFKSLAEGSTSLFSVLTAVASGALAAFAALRLMQGLVNILPFVNSLTLGLVSLSTGGLAAVALGVGALVAAFAHAQGASRRLAGDIDAAGESMLTAAKSGGTLRSALQGIASDEVRQDFMELARSMHLLDETAGEALPALAQGLGQQMVTDLRLLNQELDKVDFLKMSADLDPSTFAQFSRFAERAVEQGVTLDKVFQRNGASAGEFFEMLSKIETLSTDEGIKSLSGDVGRLAQEYPQLVSRLAAYEQAQLDTISAQSVSSAAVDQYAKELGVSAEFLQAHLDSVGVSAAGMTEKSKRAFEILEFTVDEKSGQVSARVAEMQAAVEEASTNMSEAIAGSFGGFEKVEEDSKRSLDNLLGTFRTNTQALLNEAANLRILGERGVPVDALQNLAEQGGQMVAQFVDASDKQLQRYVRLWQAHLAASDAEVIKEGDHLKGKGSSIIEQFVAGVLSNEDLSTAAARQIITSTVDAFARGDISEKGLQLALNFSHGLRTVEGLSREEGAKALRAFITAVTRRNLQSVGEQQVESLARGISASSGVSYATARELVVNTINVASNASRRADVAGKQLGIGYGSGISSSSPTVNAAARGVASAAIAGLYGPSGFAAGARLGSTFAAGIRSAIGSVGTAIQDVADAARQAFDNSLTDSPRYFTYYAGQELMKQLDEGMKKIGVLDVPRPQLRYPVGSFDSGRMMGGGRGDGRRRGLDVDVTIDRRNVAREVNWDWRAEGK